MNKKTTYLNDSVEKIWAEIMPGNRTHAQNIRIDNEIRELLTILLNQKLISKDTEIIFTYESWYTGDGPTFKYFSKIETSFQKNKEYRFYQKDSFEYSIDHTGWKYEYLEKGVVRLINSWSK